jgi:hypothetical protein
MKSAITPRPATRQKFCKAGISVNIPMKKASPSQVAAQRIDGPISLRAKAILYSVFSTKAGISRSALAIRNMLSTPIARIKNGTTSAVIMVSS